MRLACGGALPSTRQGADLGSVFSCLLAHVYPLFLLARPDKARERWPMLSSGGPFAAAALPASPPYVEVLGSLENDALGRWWRELSRREDVVEALWSTGHVSTYSFNRLPADLIHAVYDRCQLAGSLGWDGVLRTADVVLCSARRLVTGEVVSVPLLLGAGNVFTPSTVGLDLGRVTVRHWSPSDSLWKDVPPSFSSFDAVGATFLFDTELFVLRTAARSLIGWRSDQDLIKPTDEDLLVIREGRLERQGVVDRARLALVLSKGSDPTAPVFLEDSLLCPLGRDGWMSETLDGGGMSLMLERLGWPPGGAVRPRSLFTVNDAESVRVWGYRVEGADRSLGVGIRRIVAALTSRIDPEDVLIDAIISWESALGGRDAETGARSSTSRLLKAMAGVLEPEDDARRSAVRNRLRDIYRLRSDLVHGRRHSKDLRADSDIALSFGIAVLGSIVADAELASAPDSVRRSLIALRRYEPKAAE